MDSAVASGVGRFGQALPAAGSVRRSPPSLPGAGGLEEPLLRREGLAQPGSAFAVVFNLSAAAAARELNGRGACSQASACGCDPLPGPGRPPAGLPAGVSKVLPLAGAARGGKKSQSRKVLSLPPQRRRCLQRGWSRDGARLGSVCPAAPGRAPELQDPSSPSLPYPPRCLSPPLLSSGWRLQLFMPPRCRQPVHAGLVPSAFKPALAPAASPPAGSGSRAGRAAR